eukprot:NODE_100_length_20331_cov_1.214462.p4 type:complete len:428 gc:universal NODE_100_length_20331_cov_1.214462:7580-6297(-)
MSKCRLNVFNVRWGCILGLFFRTHLKSPFIKHYFKFLLLIMKSFILHKGLKENEEFNIAKINTPKKIVLTTKNCQFERRRDKRQFEEDEEGDEDFEKNKESKKMARKTKAVHNISPEEMKLRAKESRKWLLSVEEDGLANEYEGQLLNHEMSHCLFIIEKDGFQVIPTDSLYQFHPKRINKLTIDEAEKLIAQRKQEMKKVTKMEDVENKRDFKIVDKGERDIKMAGSDDELDFDIGEEFADDEEGIAVVENEDELEKQKKDMQKLRQSEEENSDDEKPTLNQAGKELQKLLKGKNVEIAEDESEENPFDSDLSDEEEPKSEKLDPKDDQKFSADSFNIKKRNNSDLNDAPLKRAKVEGLSSKSIVESTILSESEIIGIIQKNPGLSTKDLLRPLKQKIKQNPQNRDLIREILKKIANIKDGKVYLK